MKEGGADPMTIRCLELESHVANEGAEAPRLARRAGVDLQPSTGLGSSWQEVWPTSSPSRPLCIVCAKNSPT